MERYENHTLEASRRRFATKATKKCCAEAAAALARAGDDVALIFAAQTYVDAAADLQAATPETKGDAHIRLRVAACGWFAELASVEDVGDAAAVARVHALGKASTAVADAAEVVFAAESVADELAARQQLQVAEAAFERSYKATTARRRQTEARHPRPTSRAASPSSNNAYWRRVFAAQVDRREDLAARRPRPNSRTIHHLVAPQVPEPGAFKVIDPAGAELRSSSDDNDWKKVGHLTSGTVVVVDFVKKWLVSTPRACIVEQGRFVGWVDLVALARIGDDQRAATTRPRRATTRATTPDDDDEMSGDDARVVARRRGLVEEAPETPAAPAPDGSAERVAPWLAHGQNVVAALTATALREPAGRSRAFEEAVADRVAFHGSGVFAELRNGRAGASVPEAQAVVDMLAPDFQNLAVAEILGDAAPSASSPRDPSPDELAAMLQRFVLLGGNVDGLLAKAGVAPGQS